MSYETQIVYAKLGEIFAQVGSIVSMLMIIQYLIRYYNEYLLDKDFIDKVLQFIFIDYIRLKESKDKEDQVVYKDLIQQAQNNLIIFTTRSQLLLSHNNGLHCKTNNLKNCCDAYDNFISHQQNDKLPQENEFDKADFNILCKAKSMHAIPVEEILAAIFQEPLKMWLFFKHFISLKSQYIFLLILDFLEIIIYLQNNIRSKNKYLIKILTLNLINMILLMIQFIISHFFLGFGYYKFQIGIIEDFYVWASSNILYQTLSPGRSESKIFYFNIAFQKKPQIFIAFTRYDLDAGNQGFEFYTYDISTTFIHLIQQINILQQNQQLHRLLIVLDIKEEDTYFHSLINKIQQQQHQNILIQIQTFYVGIISPISLGYSGSMSYELSIIEVTQSDQTFLYKQMVQLKLIFKYFLEPRIHFIINNMTVNIFILVCIVPFHNFLIKQDGKILNLYAIISGISYTDLDILRVRINRYDATVKLKNKYDVEIWTTSYLSWVKHRFGAMKSNQQPGFYTSFKCYGFQQVRYQDDSITDSFRLIIQELSIDINLTGTTNY